MMGSNKSIINNQDNKGQNKKHQYKGRCQEKRAKNRTEVLIESGSFKQKATGLIWATILNGPLNF